MKIIILYKDGSIKIIKENLINAKKLASDRIKTILIPLIETLDAYIPIKPSEMYDFKKATVSIIYSTYYYNNTDCEVDAMEDQKNRHYYHEFTSLIDFINGIYNVYKFRAIPMYFADNMHYSWDYYPVIAIRQIKVTIYKKDSNIIYHLNSKEDLGDLSEYPSTAFMKSSPEYINEDRFKCLKEILYIPAILKGAEITDIYNIPNIIKITDTLWKKIKKPKEGLKPSDIILYKISDFEVYYMITYQMYLSIVFNKITEKIKVLPITISDSTVKISEKSKNDLINDFNNSEIDDIFQLNPPMYKIDSFLQTLVFLNTILNYTNYFTKYYYCNDVLEGSYDIISYVIFGDNNYPPSDRLFVKEVIKMEELTYDRKIKAFIKMLNL